MPAPISRAVKSGELPARRSAAAARAVASQNKYSLQTGTAAAVEQHVLAILAAGFGTDLATLMANSKAADGSLALDSMNAVFVLSIIRKVVGRKGWTRLTKANSGAADFKSARALANLVSRLRPQAGTA